MFKFVFGWYGLALKNFKSKKILITNKFKKRRLFFFPRKFVLRFGTIGLFTIKQVRIENIHVKILKKIFKRRKRSKRGTKYYPKKIWFRLGKNTFLSKKSKNSRMGSGKGKLLRRAFTIRGNNSLIEFKFFTHRYLTKFPDVINYKIKLELVVAGCCS